MVLGTQCPFFFYSCQGSFNVQEKCGKCLYYGYSLLLLPLATIGYAVSPVVVVVLAVVITIVKGVLFLVSRVMTSVFIWKINLLRDLSLVAQAKPVQSGEEGLLVMHVCLKLLWHPWYISHRYQDIIKQQQHLVRANQQHQKWKNKMHSKE